MRRAYLSIIPFLLVMALLGCAAKVADKKVIQMHYTGTLADGSTFDSSEGKDPLEFMVGAQLMIPKLEEALLGMKVGEKKKIEIKAADAYGDYDTTAIAEVPKEQFPTDLPLKAGEQYTVQTAQGPIVVTISAVKDKTVTVDFNHPLAGKDLSFDITIVKIRDATKEELAEIQKASTATPEQVPQ